MLPREFKITIIHNLVQIISPCSQWLAKCHVTIQRCSAAPAPKLSGTEKATSLSSPDAEDIFKTKIGKQLACRRDHRAQGLLILFFKFF